MRNANFKSYRARGTWEDFEMVDLDSDDAAGSELAQVDLDQDPSQNQNTQASPETTEQTEADVDQSELLESDPQSNQSTSDIPPEN